MRALTGEDEVFMLEDASGLVAGGESDGTASRDA